MTASRKEAKEKILALVRALPSHERKLLNKILKIERASLHLKSPHVKDELMNAVREEVK